MKTIEKLEKDSVWKLLLGISALLFMIILILKTQDRETDYAAYGFVASVGVMLVRIGVVIFGRQRNPDCYLNRLAGEYFALTSTAYMILLVVISRESGIIFWGIIALATICLANAFLGAVKPKNK